MNRNVQPIRCRPRLVSELRMGATSAFVGDKHEIVASELSPAVLERTLRGFNGGIQR
jgi:hypothetical protein